MKLSANGGDPGSLRGRILSLPTLLSFAVAVVFIFFLATRFDLDWGETWNNVRGLDIGLYAMALVTYYASFIVRGARWRLLVRNVEAADGAGDSLPGVVRFSQLVLVGWFVNAVAWLRLGEAYRAFALSNESGLRFSLGLGTILAERFTDMVTVLVLVVVGVSAFTAERGASDIVYVVVAAFAMAMLLAGLMAAMRGYGTRLARFLPTRVQAAYLGFQTGTLDSLRQLRLVFALGLAAWILEIGRLYFVTRSLDMEIGWSLVVVVALGHAILSTVPTPGGVGAVEPGVTGLLVLGLPRNDAASVALVDRSITYLSVLVLGGLAFLLLQASQTRRKRAAAAVAGGPAADY